MSLRDQEVPVAGDFDAGQPILEVEDLRVELRQANRTATILDGVSYTLYPGKALALVGESGAGKSVSTRAVLGLLDRTKFDVSGRVRLAGADLAALSRGARRRHVATHASLVFQDPMRSLNPTMRVGWQIAEAMYKTPNKALAISKSEARKRSVQLLRDVGIAAPEERFEAYPHQLSGGMRQRVVIAIAIACRSKVVFCDEPTSSLDVTTQAQIMDLLDGMRTSLGLSTVLITHDLALAASRVDEVMVMYHGRLVEKLPAAGLVQNVMMPYTQALLRSVPDHEGGIPDPLPSLPYRLEANHVGCHFAPLCSRAQEKCREETPELEELAEGHLCRCFFPALGSSPGVKPSE